MKFLVDTHIVLWAAVGDKKLSREVREILSDDASVLYVSAASIWEVAIKSLRGDRSFNVHPQALRRGLEDNGYIELPIRSEHTLEVYNLPVLHRDPFDRILIAQAMVEGVVLLTSDHQVAQYPGPIRKV